MGDPYEDRLAESDASALGRMKQAKGTGYEQHVARLFQQWYGARFMRVPLSGGLPAEFKLAGDLMCAEDFPFYVECKKHEGVYLEHLFKGTGKPPRWWRKAVAEAAMFGVKPMLVFARNNWPDMVGLQYEVALELVDKALAERTQLRWSTPEGWVVVLLLSDFFQYADPAHARRMVATQQRHREDLFR